jgi:hypothetical protein
LDLKIDQAAMAECGLAAREIEFPHTAKPFIRANALPRMSPAPAEIGEAEIEEIVNVAIICGERAIHVGFPEGRVGIQGQPRNDGSIGNADSHGVDTAADMMGASVRRNNRHCTSADNLPEQAPQ